MPRLLLAVSFVLLLMMTAVWTRAAQQPGAADLEAARFTGKTTVLEPAGVGVTRRRFEAGRAPRGTAIQTVSCCSSRRDVCGCRSADRRSRK